MSAHSAPVLDAAFTPSGQEVVTVSEDGTARLWDGHDGRRLARFQGARAAVISLAVSCDGAHLATGSSDAVARVYDLTYKGRTSLLPPSGGPPGDARHEQQGC